MKTNEPDESERFQYYLILFSFFGMVACIISGNGESAIALAIFIHTITPQKK